ncbi:MAG: PEP-CTERM sorting domain-containing protein [Bdellovibrionales bacterium]|nr:PEP-CTERM sorting domain-containing protein [Bdellovibrionales bacterium]
MRILRVQWGLIVQKESKVGRQRSRLGRSFRASLAFGVGLLFIGLSSAEAVTMTNAGSARAGFSFPLGDVSKSSYDGPAFDAFKPFAGFTGSEILQLNSFTSHEQGSMLEVFLLSESAYFDGRDPNFANNFGVLDEAGNFISILDSASAKPGDSGSILQGSNDAFTFALKSPEALFSADDKDNKDGMAHLVAQRVEKDGEVLVDPTSLRNTPPLSFQLFEGDMIIYIEDMLAQFNQQFLNVPALGDFDYNDMVVVVRQTEIPEPASVVLLGSALLGFGRFRRRQA